METSESNKSAGATASDTPQTSTRNPLIVFLFSGKRKCGKDYVADRLKKLFGQGHLVCPITVSAPLKDEYANKYGLDVKKLMDSSSYKEEFRQAMIAWGEKIRQEDAGYFCRKAIEQGHAHQFPIWIITDARRRSDLLFFRHNYGSKLKTIRVTASVDTRKNRHWHFTPGVDDAESECGLDEIDDWDWIIENDGDEEQLLKRLQEIKQIADYHIPTIVQNAL